MAQQWYTRAGQQQGPVSANDLRRLAEQGQLLPTDLIWAEGMKEWVPAGQSARLFPSSAGAPAGETPRPLNSPTEASEAPTPPTPPGTRAAALCDTIGRIQRALETSPLAISP